MTEHLRKRRDRHRGHRKRDDAEGDLAYSPVSDCQLPGSIIDRGNIGMASLQMNEDLWPQQSRVWLRQQPLLRGLFCLRYPATWP